MEMQTAALLAAKGRPSVAKLRENSTLIVPVVVPARLIDNSTQPDHIFFPHERSGTSSAEQDMQYKPRAVVGSSARAAYSSIVETVRLSLACKSLRSVLIVQQLERAGAFAGEEEVISFIFGRTMLLRLDGKGFGSPESPKAVIRMA